MGFFDKLGAQLTNAGRTVSQNVKNATDSSSLNREISSHQKNIQQRYAEIGQLFYEKYSQNPESEFTEQMDSIKKSVQEIARLQAEIEEVKARKAELVPIPEDAPNAQPSGTSVAMVCQNCGNTYDADQSFCIVCGSRLVPKYSVQPSPQEPIPQQVAPSEPTEVPAPESSEPVEIPIPEPVNPTPSVNLEKEEDSSEQPDTKEIPVPPSLKYCNICGTENEGDSDFCINCGSALN